MLRKKLASFNKLAKKVKSIRRVRPEPSQYQALPKADDGGPPPVAVPAGFLPVYVGEERERFVVRTGYLSHPLFKMLLEKAYHEFGYRQSHGLAVPCQASTFREVMAAVKGGRGRFEFGKVVEEFVCTCNCNFRD
ncbi:hypothetical protein NMG60_11001475 [Bertholletia excelsa]